MRITFYEFEKHCPCNVFKSNSENNGNKIYTFVITAKSRISNIQTDKNIFTHKIYKGLDIIFSLTKYRLYCSSQKFNKVGF